ncbi:adenylyl cyclase X E-like [Drosophila bipectinata]|uniref:adenylyl cyclase X E-like n=1 Tax=Drosophila bipectinata TaxID=42026 RepID=UPI001C8A7296|nr:adenylyl cyclase X E-like [Drosophila bipectinata]
MNRRRVLEFKNDSYTPRSGRACRLYYSTERHWEPDYLKGRCFELGLEEQYNRYQIRLVVSYLGAFFLLHIFLTVLHCLAAVFLTSNHIYVHVDLLFSIVSAAVLLLVLSINFFVNFVTNHPWIMTLSATIATVVAVVSDIGQVIYSEHEIKWKLEINHYTYYLCMVYMFLPIISHTVAIIMGTGVSLIYISYYIYCLNFVKINQRSYNYFYIIMDLLHYICFNVMGIYYRMMNDMLTRSSFLDRHQFIVEEMWLRNARPQESRLLNAILPSHIANYIQSSIKERILQTETGLRYDRHRHKSTVGMAIQIHPDVSILYADVVNYTHLTTTLPVEDLILVLHDLYARFDVAASHFNVQRIKFLGDCYYCVAGLTSPNPDHAQTAVSLGISMIANIQEVREEWNLNIDMRIGVHSGDIIAGVIGEAKLQFDIWGPAVDFANLLESTGEAGYVHVSSTTMQMLNVEGLFVKPGTNETMNTYLITGVPPRASVRRTLDYSGLFGFDPKAYHEPIHNWSSYVDPTTEQLEDEFKKIPVGGIEPICWIRDNNKEEYINAEVGHVFVAFNDSSLEWNYLRRPDYIIKYTALLVWIMGCCLIYLQLVTIESLCLLCIAIDILVFLFLSAVLAICWYKKYCFWKSEGDENKIYSRCSCRIFNLFEKIQQSITKRIVLYLTVVFLYLIMISQILNNCEYDLFQLKFIDARLFMYQMDADICFRPWEFTKMMSLLIGMSYTFARIPFSLKMGVCLLEGIYFMVVVLLQYEFIFHHSKTTVPYMPAEAAHCKRIIVMLLTFYFKERRVEFNTKMNFKINLDMKKKQESADLTNASIKILLNNILPAHVVEVYLTNLANHELYYENYDLVSVMFAMLSNFQIDLSGLRVLNDIITEFDRLLNVYKEYYVVEKIKVVGGTYMAACGLDYTQAAKIGRSQKNALVIEAERASRFRQSLMTAGNIDYGEINDQEEVVFVMASFALDLMRTLFMCNQAYQKKPFERTLKLGEICIGISSGEIMAGVVGASQPHYDIWGSPVNMASRMQSTGMAGRIHVTEESALILIEYGISSTFRGMTYVKGVGEIPTYFLDIDDEYNFVLLEEEEAFEQRQSVKSLRSTVSHNVHYDASSYVDLP